MPILQKPLQGLAKFLGITTQGALRIDSTDRLLPVLELSDFIEPPVWVTSVATLALDGNIDVTVPQNRKWWIQFISATVTPPAGVRCNSQVALFRAGTSTPIVISPQNLEWGVGGNNYLHSDNQASGYGFAPGKLIAEPGDVLRLDLYKGTGAGNNTARFHIQIQEVET